MVDTVKQSVDTALDDHTYRIRTEVSWIKSKYQEKMEVRKRRWITGLPTYLLWLNRPTTSKCMIGLSDLQGKRDEGERLAGPGFAE